MPSLISCSSGATSHVRSIQGGVLAGPDSRMAACSQAQAFAVGAAAAAGAMTPPCWHQTRGLTNQSARAATRLPRNAPRADTWSHCHAPRACANLKTFTNLPSSRCGLLGNP